MATYRVPVLEDFAWQPPVEDRVVNVPTPSLASQGTRFLVIATGSDQFAGQENDIATATVSDPSAASDWMFDTPLEGHTVWVKDEDAWYVFDGAAWNKESVNTIQSQILLLESEMSQVESRVLVLESEMSDVNSNLLVEKSTVNDVSELLSETISDFLVEKSIVNDVSEATSQTMSRVLVLESEMSDINSNLLVEKSTVNDVSEAVSQTMSRVLVLESEMSSVSLAVSNVSSAESQTQSRVLVLESEMAAAEGSHASNASFISALTVDKQDLGTYVAAYGAIQFTV